MGQENDGDAHCVGGWMGGRRTSGSQALSARTDSAISGMGCFSSSSAMLPVSRMSVDKDLRVIEPRASHQLRSPSRPRVERNQPLPPTFATEPRAWLFYCGLHWNYSESASAVAVDVVRHIVDMEWLMRLQCVLILIAVVVVLAGVTDAIPHHVLDASTHVSQNVQVSRCKSERRNSNCETST